MPKLEDIEKQLDSLAGSVPEADRQRLRELCDQVHAAVKAQSPELQQLYESLEREMHRVAQTAYGQNGQPSPAAGERSGPTPSSSKANGDVIDAEYSEVN